LESSICKYRFSSEYLIVANLDIQYVIFATVSFVPRKCILSAWGI